MRTITIKGGGKSIKSPDLIILKIEIEITEEEFDVALNSMTDLINKLNDSLENIGFSKNDLKTISYNIERNYDYVKKGIINKEYENKFAGYEISQELKLEFDFDTTILSDVLNSLNEFTEYLDFELIFSVKDKELMKKEVLINATKNAKFNAEILAEASEAKLGQLLKIEYEWDDTDFKSNTQLYGFEGYSRRSAVLINQTDIVPEDIEISDVVTFVWELI
ncbi:SIMPL domain-containing protein [Methanobrevibacter sp.]